MIMPKKPTGEGGRPPEDDTDPEKTGVKETGVKETDTGEITQDVEGVEIDETFVSVAPDEIPTSIRPRTGELAVLPDELELPEEDASDKPHIFKLGQAETRALSQSGAEDERDEPTDPGLKRPATDVAKRRRRFQKLWVELGQVAGKKIEQKLFTELENRRKAGEDVGVLLEELEKTVANRRELASAADLPADQVVGQGDDTLENRARKELKGEIRRARSVAEEETLRPDATQVVRQRGTPRGTPRRPESTEVIPPKPRPKPKEKSWWQKLQFWKK